MRPRQRRVLAAVLFGLVPVLVALPSMGRPTNDDDPRNLAPPESRDELDCLGCHRGWGMYDTHVVQALFPQELLRGEPARFDVRVDDPWQHELRGLHVTVRLLDAGSGLVPIGLGRSEPPHVEASAVARGELTNPTVAPVAGRDAPPTEASIPIPLRSGVSGLRGHLELYPLADPSLPGPLGLAVEAQLLTPHRAAEGAWSKQDADATSRDVVLDAGNATPGAWSLHLSFKPGAQPRVAYAFNWTVQYGGGGPDEFDVPVPSGRVRAHEGVDAPFDVVGSRDGTFRVEVAVRATTHYRHNGTGGYNWDNYTRYRTVDVVVGDHYVGALSAAPVLPGGASGSFSVVVGEVVGIASAGLLPPALVVGGTYGRASRRLFNALLGGARRRVLFHSAVSLGLTAAAVVHAGLFLQESRYGLTVGLLWGGLGLVALFGLALTGYYQVPLIQKYGFRSWRVLHLGLGVAVVLFTATHALLDGSHFGAVREHLPAWIANADLR